MKINVYSQEACTPCWRLKGYLDSCGVEYDDIDVRKNPDALTKIKDEWGFRVTPVVEVEGWDVFENPSIVTLREIVACAKEK